MAERSSLVLTIIGPDRQGLVEALSRVIADHDGNWLESRMARLAGQFAGLLLVSVPADRRDALRDAVRELASEDLQIVVRPGEAAVEPARLVLIEVVGHDRPGIVHELAHALKQRNVNVEELTSESYSAPMTGEPLFKARARLGVGQDIDMDELQQGLERVARGLSLDLSFEQPQPGNSAQHTT